MSMSAGSGVTGRAASTVKVLVTGGAGVGKSCFLRAAQRGRSTLPGQPGVVGEVGYATLPSGVTVVLHVTPELRRWWWVWDHLALGACGAIVLVDATRLPVSYPALDYLDARDLPYLVAINRPLGGTRNRHEIRDALRVTTRVPVVTCDATEPDSVLAVLHHLTGPVLPPQHHAPRSRNPLTTTKGQLS
ncbi:hypothetical protein [Micromonospora sp. NPDC085948]|uniref:hypothetical protein n=1 Tax=Micromonospora sp. NPDC085948 TaxID=3155293 RepID=UPI00342377B5